MKYGIKYIQHLLWTHPCAILTERGYEAWVDNTSYRYTLDTSKIKFYEDINDAYAFVSTQQYQRWRDDPLSGFCYVVEEIS